MTPETLRTTDVDYVLPPELIAQEPLTERAASRLLVVLRNDRRQGPADRRRVPRIGVLPRRISLMGERIPIGASAVVDSAFTELPSLIAPGDLLVLNTTKVRHARLLGSRHGGRDVATGRPTAPGAEPDHGPAGGEDRIEHGFPRSR